MADVRLTAVNPENSEVYPVACNDKGELILNGASRLEVAEFLDVASTTYADNTGLYLGTSPGNINFREIRLEKDGSAQFSDVVQVGGFVSYVRTNAGDQNIARFSSDVGGLNVDKITFTADGSATFAGGLSKMFNNGSVGSLRIEAFGGLDGKYAYFYGGAGEINLLSDGGANFAGTVATQRLNSGSVDHTVPAITGLNGSAINGTFYSRNNGGGVSPCYQAAGGDGLPKASINNDGSAQFSGNVSAPNITFKLAPATAASMPAPLIDEGFAVEGELDLLSELIKMKLQIRDLNAFMQRTLQDGAETQQ